MYLIKKNLAILVVLLTTEMSFTQNWQLVWQDEFNYSGRPDDSKWSYDTGAGGWGNHEVQYYSAGRQENARVENGHLVIEARRDWHGAEYSSARLVSRNKGDWKYGRIEVCAKLPLGAGMWPAIWMLPTDWVYGGWPASGEIDIMENFAVSGVNPYGVHGTVHTQSYNHMIGTNKGSYKGGLSHVEQNYHIYAVNWYYDRLEFEVDGQRYFTFYNEGNWQAWPFDQRFHLILNIAVGGSLGGEVDPNIFPKKMEVDYVRVYQQEGAAPSTTGLVTVYKDCHFSGYSGGLAPGDYTLSKLQEKGVMNDDLSSLRVTEGFKVILYEHDDFGGASLAVTADNPCLDNWNDRVSSLRVRPNGMQGLDGTYTLQNRVSGLFMDVRGGLGATGNGASVQQWFENRHNNQRFTFSHQGDGCYTIKAAHSGKVLDVRDVSLVDGGALQQWTDYTSSNQQFIVVAAEDGYVNLIAKHSGKLVEVSDASLEAEAQVQQWQNVGQPCGEWKMVLLEEPTSSSTTDSPSALGIYPNPLGETLRIKGILPSNCRIVIRDALGRTCVDQPTPIQTIDTSTLPAGMYFLHISMHGTHVIKKLVKH